MKKLLLLFFINITPFLLFSQQEAVFTHYMHNTQAVNPGYVGTREALTVTALYRRQWVGFKGAPETQSITIHTPLQHRNFGVGLSLVNDKLGPLQSQIISADFAYKLRIDNERYLSIGIKGGVEFKRNSVSRLYANDEGDATIDVDDIRNMFGDAGAGLYYYGKSFYIGASATGLLREAIGGGNTNFAAQEIHTYLIAGTYFKVAPKVEFKPTTLVRIVSNAPIQAEITGTFIFNKKFTTGAFYRGGDGIGALLGMYVRPNIYTGYSYDYSLSNSTGLSNLGTHEIVITYDFYIAHKNVIRSPRYF